MEQFKSLRKGDRIKMNIKDTMKNITTKIFKKNSFILNIIIIVLVNIVGLSLYFRIDLTENSAYSLSGISQDVVSTLEEPLIIKVFFSKNLPAPYNTIFRYLTDILDEYSQYGNENFSYEFIDVEKNKKLSTDYGITPIQIREVQNDQIKFRNAYMGLVIVHGDVIEKIDAITEHEGIEYKISNLIKKMTGKIDSLLKLKTNIQITLIASSDLPIQDIENINSKVSEQIKKCNIRNYNKLEYKYVDPKTDKSVMDAADIYGIPKLNWPAFKTMQGKRISAGEGMIGIVIEYNKKFETIQLLSRNIFGQYTLDGLNNLEERINNSIDNLISINPQIGYITSHGERDLNRDGSGAANFKKLIADMYEFKEIDLKKNNIPDGINLIIINGPRNKYSGTDLLKIDQFLMKGKSILFLLDSFFEYRPQGMGMNQMPSQKPIVLPNITDVEKLVAHYGVNINPDILLDQNCFQPNQPGFRGQNVYYAPIIGEKGLDRENIITKYLKTIVFLKSSSLSFNEEIIKKLGIKKKILVSSSDKSWLMKGKITFLPWMIQPPGKSKMSKYNLAVLLTGKFESYFMNKEIPINEEETKGKSKGKKSSPIKSQETLKSSLKSGSIIVIGTSEITASNVVDKDGKTLNAIFLHNMIDYLSRNYDIPEMRSKGLVFNPLNETSDNTKLFIKLFNIAGLPFIVIIIGLLIWKKKAIKKRRLQEEF